MVREKIHPWQIDFALHTWSVWNALDDCKCALFSGKGEKKKEKLKGFSQGSSNKGNRESKLKPENA